MGYRGKRMAGGGLAWAAAAAVLAVAVFLALRAMPPARSSPPPDESAGADVSVEPAASSGDVSQPPSASSGDVSLPREPDVSAAAVQTPEPYDFSQPVPEGEAVDNSYFADAAFVGDSRTDGFMIYSGIGTGKNLTSNGLSIFKLAEKKALTIGGKEYTLLEALALEEYGKVYLSLGVNELGYHDDQGFYNSYCEAIDQIRALQPQAVIYIQGLIPLNEEQIMASSGREYLTNEHLRIYNGLMRQAAEEKQAAFLDLYSEFADENGALAPEASRDGVHLGKEYCQQWLEYLKTHTVELDTLYPDGPPAVEAPAPDQPDTSATDGSVQG